MTTLRAGDLVRRKTGDTREMLVSQIMGSNAASCAWYDDDGNYNFATIHPDELETSVEAHRRAKVMQERADAAREAAADPEPRV